MNEIYITTKDFLEMAQAFRKEKMDYVVIGVRTSKAGKTVMSFSATRDDIDYEMKYEFEEK